jgi:hypothetical protein
VIFKVDERKGNKQGVFMGSLCEVQRKSVHRRYASTGEENSILIKKKIYGLMENIRERIVESFQFSVALGNFYDYYTL